MSQFAPEYLRVPPGFEHLLEGLAREVLREQPSDIITFAANYFREKLILRDGKDTWVFCFVNHILSNQELTGF